MLITSLFESVNCNENLLKNLICSLIFIKIYCIVDSIGDENKYRRNQYIDAVWKDCYKLNQEHFYHIGAKEENRNSMMEALLMNYDPLTIKLNKRKEYEQLSFVFSKTKKQAWG